MEVVGILYIHLIYFAATLVYAVWSILWLFGILFPFWYVVPRKIWQPCRELRHEGVSRTLKSSFGCKSNRTK
jgi:hypothetical protein